MTKKIFGPQDERLSIIDQPPQECPRCIDERLIKLASAIGYLVCPNCDLVIKEDVIIQA